MPQPGDLFVVLPHARHIYDVYEFVAIYNPRQPLTWLVRKPNSGPLEAWHHTWFEQIYHVFPLPSKVERLL